MIDDDPLADYARRHRLSPAALAELRTLSRLSSESWGSALTLDAPTDLSLETRAESSAPAADDPPASAPALGTARYTVLGRLGVGGQGEVFRVFDQRMQRPLAMKVLRPLASVQARARFHAETALTVGLEHPGIVPIYERGLTEDGRPWYTMQILEGADFRGMIADVGQPLRRRVDVFVRACEAVAHAHERGVLHRDLKPQNIMIGAFGEVRVLDWGLARRLGDRDDDRAGLDGAARPEPDPLRTRAGAIMGTPRYMAPEQLAGDLDRLGPPSDVYALGLILAELLTGRPPAGRTLVEIGALRAADLPPPAAGPEPLRRLCAEATRVDPARRPADAGVMAAAVRTWLEDAEKRAQAAALVVEARAIEPRIAALRDAARALDDEAAAVLDPLPDHAPVAAKRPAWALSDEAEAKRRAARVAEVELRQRLQSALRLDPASTAARDALTAHYRARLLEAEAAHDADRAAEFEALLSGHDSAGNVEWLRGDGKVTLFTDPAGATVEVLRYEERDRRLVEVPLGRVETAPLVELPLAMGSYLLKLRHPGRSAVRYPVHIGRHGVWDGVPPGEDRPFAIPLPKVGEVGEHECYVPAGWTTLGGDPDATDGLPAHRLWVDGFVIDRDPVDHAAYMAWLDAMAARHGRGAVRSMIPSQGIHDEAPARGYRWATRGSLELTEAFGYRASPDWPVVAVSLLAARGFATWRSVVGPPLSVPTSTQWEKAARGVDGRHYPWGDAFEVNWANVLNHRDEAPMPSAPASHPHDVSPYGVRGLGGNVRDLCDDLYVRDGTSTDDGRPAAVSAAPEGAFALVKGGSYVSGAQMCRAATRLAMPVGERLAMVGFRLCRPFEPVGPGYLA